MPVYARGGISGRVINRARRRHHRICQFPYRQAEASLRAALRSCMSCRIRQMICRLTAVGTQPAFCPWSSHLALVWGVGSTQSVHVSRRRAIPDLTIGALCFIYNRMPVCQAPQSSRIQSPSPTDRPECWRCAAQLPPVRAFPLLLGVSFVYINFERRHRHLLGAQSRCAGIPELRHGGRKLPPGLPASRGRTRRCRLGLFNYVVVAPTAPGPICVAAGLVQSSFGLGRPRVASRGGWQRPASS